ncbi:hypothetical protein ATDW_28260 [Asticcacaulis sp. DW145]|uniref:Uncharacterized protein n=1 Tax=Asticcacaulis currens TaxID=2984210 RepID=A0ABT5IJG3_9CAUL|nr:hypothetical protein [Asticcacaulis currens]MDC7695995.1 hypothetical protein [Asticcacaulis currens]BEV12330.1 hypothetical protein ATDW_28260 [Asticcacaulis sp. DW145]
MNRAVAVFAGLAALLLLTAGVPLRGPLTGPEWVVWGSGVAAFVVGMLGLLAVLRRGILHVLVHIGGVALLTAASVWMLQHAQKGVEDRLVICALGLGVLTLWSLWAASGFAVGNKPPDSDDDSFLQI